MNRPFFVGIFTCHISSIPSLLKSCVSGMQASVEAKVNTTYFNHRTIAHQEGSLEALVSWHIWRDGCVFMNCVAIHEITRKRLNDSSPF